MLNVMVVDDEPLVRILLKSIIEWNNYGLELIGEAENGNQCLAFLEKNIVDVIITDIKMPVIDGVELIKTVKNKYPQIMIIVLSAYDEFDFVKEALLNGAEDYILKSDIGESSFVKTIEKVKNKIENYRSRLQNEINLVNYVAESNNMQKESFIRSQLLFPAEIDKNTLANKIKQYEINYYGQYFMIILMICEKNPNKKGLDKIIVNFINELYGKDNNIYCLVSDTNEITILKSYEHMSEKNISQMIYETTNSIFNNLKKFLNIDITVSASNHFSSFVKLHDIYKKTKTLFNYSFYIENSNILFEHDLVNIEHPVDMKFVNELFDNFKYEIDRLAFDDAKKVLRKITAEFTNHYSSENFKTVKYYCKILTVIVDKSIELSLYNKVFLEDLNPYDFLLSCRTIFLIEDFLIHLIDAIQLGSGIDLTTRFGETIGKVMNYVLQNYNTDINLNKVAAIFNFNPSYLSTKFKEITKISFNEYLNRIRIENAKTMIAERKYKLNKISSLVGYTDQRYFCKIFKKVVGTTAREYKESL